MVAQGLGRLIAETAELIAVVNNGRELVDSTRTLRPDIIVSDLTMPVMSGLEAMRQLKADGLNARFIFLTIHRCAPRGAGTSRRRLRLPAQTGSG